MILWIQHDIDTAWYRTEHSNGKTILSHWGWDKIAAILQTEFSNKFSSILIQISFKIVFMVPSDSKLALLQIMACAEQQHVIIWTNDGYFHWCVTRHQWVNTLRPRQNGHHFADDIFKCIFFNENVWISISILLNFVPNGSINNIPALLQITAWRQPGDKPLFEPMMVSLLMHACITRPQLVNKSSVGDRHSWPPKVVVVGILLKK